MNSFVFNSFKENFLNGNVPSAMNWTFIPMNNKFVDNFTSDEFSIEQFRNVGDLNAFTKNNYGYGYLYNDSKLKYDGIEYTWTKIIETEERNKPMFINSENYDSLTASEEYWSLFSANDNINSYVNSGGFYILRTKEELNWFADSVNDGNNGIIGVLADNISNKISVMIGNDESIPFQGVLDGNGFSLTAPEITCTASDNGLIGVLGQNGIVRNFVIETNNDYKNAWLKCEKQINLNYLKHDARDVNAGLLVGRNYGNVENIALDIKNFKFSGFVPQVYSVSNKSDEYTDFKGIRKKFDDGENFFFLNSWCVNSPANICPYVGYFAEGIFAEHGFRKFTDGDVKNTEYNPKMKAYYDTGADEYTLDLSETDEEGNPVVHATPLGLYIKYDWYRDEVLNPGGGSNNLLNYNNNVAIDFLCTHNAGLASQHIDHHIADNSVIRTTQLDYISDDIIKSKSSSFSKSNRKALLEDPTWLSYNDDPAGRNAVMFLKCEFKNSANKSKTVYLEVNGILTHTKGGDKEGRLRFVAGKIDTSQFSPISESEPNLYGDTSEPLETLIQNPCEWYTLDLGNNKKVYARCGILFTSIGGWNNSEMGVCDIVCDERKTYDEANWNTAGLKYNEPSPISTDTSDSVRAFTIDNEENVLHELNITSINGFKYSITIDTENIFYTALNQDNVGFRHSPILANAVADTTKDLCDCGDYTIRFKSKCLSSRSDVNVRNDDKSHNDTHIKNPNGDYSKYDLQGFIDTYGFSEELYTIDDENNSLYKCVKKHHLFLHANDYKQLIALNYNGYYASRDDRQGGLGALIKALRDYSSSTDEYKKYYEKIIQRCCEKVKKSTGEHKKLEINDIKKYINELKDGIFNNITKLIKYEIDYTSVSRASGIDDGPILRNNVKYGVDFLPSRHIYIFKNEGAVINEFKTYFEQRPYNRIYDKSFEFSLGAVDDALARDDEGQTTVVKPSLFVIDNKNSFLKYQFNPPGGSISVSEFNLEKFIYSPYITTTDNNFDAGRSYNALTIGGEYFENIYSAANMYVKQPVYCGLDFEGNWTTMPVRYYDFNNSQSYSETSAANQINYNWNIIRKMYENKLDPEKDEETFFWKGLYYDDNISIVYDADDNPDYKYKDIAGNDTEEHYNEWTECSLVPAGILNKPIRMHNMVRAAYNISPLVGANYGTIHNVSGTVNSVTNSGNYVCFIGGIAGKNTNGTIKDVKITLKYNLSNPKQDEYGASVYYKNTPLLPYAATKTISIPKDPELNPNIYGVFPTEYYNAITAEYKSDIRTISDTDKTLMSAVSCISFFDDFRDNPQYMIDNIEYEQMSNFKYFTSAWYDTSQSANEKTDDVIQYNLSPIFVIGGIAGRVVASNASSMTMQLKTNIENVYVSNKNVDDLPLHDMHSMFGSLIGQVDIYTSDVSNSSNKIDSSLVELHNVSAKQKNPYIGYVDYQPIDTNNVVALYGWSRKSKYGDDYIGYTTDTLYGIDQPILINHSSEDDNGSFYKVSTPPEFSVINQSSAAFILPNQAEASDGYYETIFKDVIKMENVGEIEVKQRNVFTDFASDIYNDKYNGPISVNAVFGSNTRLDYVNRRDYLDNKRNVRTFKRCTEKITLSTNDGIYSNDYISKLENSLTNDVFAKKNIEDMFFSYTYTTSPATDDQVRVLSGEMFNGMPVKFFGDIEGGNKYIADFGDQDGTLGDDINYDGHNNIVFGRSMSPTYIRHELNKDENKNGFNSYLFSAYQLDEDGNHIPANHDNQLGGFLVVNQANDDLVMFISNDNGAEIDGRSYNLAFPSATMYEPAKGSNYPQRFTTGGVVLDIDTNNMN